MVNVTSNGFIYFGASSFASTSGAIPERTDPNGVIAAYWLDLLTRDTGVCIGTVGTAPNRRYIVQWADAAYYPTRVGNLTFEIVLNETTNTVDMIYQSLGTPERALTVGLETLDGVDAAVLCSNSRGCPVTTGTRIRWVPTP